MNADEKELLKVGAETALKPFANLIEKLFGGAVEQFGGIWEDRLAIRRQIRRIRLFEKLRRAIDDAGFDPRAIPDNIWIPALQEALLQDDETIQQLWANLLANSADPRQQNAVHSSFVGMIKDLAPREAKFLNVLYDEASRPGFSLHSSETIFSDVKLKGAFVRAGLARCLRLSPLNLGDIREGGEDLQLDLKDFAMTLAIVIRFGLLRPLVETEALDVSALVRGTRNAPRRLNVPMSTKYIFTELANQFVRACLPPTRS